MCGPVLEITQDGLHVPGDLIEELGLKPGAKVILDPSGTGFRVRLETPAEEQIERSALDYLMHNVGDATAVRRPERLPNGRWRVPVVLSYDDRLIGTLTFSEHGVLIREQSDVRQRFWL